MTPLKIKVPMPIARLADSGKRHRAAKGGRGSGKSYSIHGIEALKSSIERRRVLVLRETQNSLAESSLAVLKRVIRDWGIEGAYIDTKHGVAGVNGSEFIFRGLQHADRVKSLEDVDACIVEEAQRIPRDAITTVIPTVRKAGSYFWWIWNPDTPSDPVDVEIVQSGRPDAAVEIVNHNHNAWFKGTELYNEMVWDRENDYEKYLHVWEGKPRSISDSLVFGGKFRVASFDLPVDGNDQPIPEALYFGADWGFAHDPTALVRCYVHDERLWVDYEAYGVGVEIVETPQLFMSVPGASKWGITADSARPEVISHMNNNGFRVQSARKGKGSVEDGIGFLRSFREIVVHERCKHMADELGLYSYKRDRMTGEVLPILEDRDNHCIDALRYAVEKLMLSKRAPMVSITERIW